MSLGTATVPRCACDVETGGLVVVQDEGSLRKGVSKPQYSYCDWPPVTDPLLYLCVLESFSRLASESAVTKVSFLGGGVAMRGKAVRNIT